MPQAIIIKPHRSKYPNPIKLCRGDRVKVGKRDSEYKDWIWCTTKSGVEGWVPEIIIDTQKNIGIVLEVYDATELDVDTYDSVTILKEESGWFWCRKDDGSEGWVPVECVMVEE